MNSTIVDKISLISDHIKSFNIQHFDPNIKVDYEAKEKNETDV
jgi:hypothetical protein